MICPSGYDNLWSNSTHCYRIVKEEVTWEEAKVKCQEDEAELACFSNLQERDAVSDQCDMCWVGYTKKGGMYKNMIGSFIIKNAYTTLFTFNKYQILFL